MRRGPGGCGLWKRSGGGRGLGWEGRSGDAGGHTGGGGAGPHLSTTKAEALWLTEAECRAHLPLGSSRVWMV